MNFLTQLEEECKAKGSERRGDDPEPDDHLGLRPALLLEMMVYGRHEEHALAGSLETRNLNHHRKRLGDEQAAHDKGDDLGVGKHGDGGQSTTQGEGAVSPMKICAG